MVDDSLAHRLEQYYDAVPRSAARAVSSGPFTLFVSTGPWPYYARPRLGLQVAITVADVVTLRAEQRARSVPEQVEWQPSVTPSLEAACREAGLSVVVFPQLVHRSSPAPPAVDAQVRLLDPSDDLGAVLSVQQRAFGGLEQVAASDVAFAAGRVRRGETVVVVAEQRGRPVAVGMHQPVGPVSEIVGVATLPEHRHRGLGATVTAALVGDARRRGAEVVFLSAGDEATARIYRRVGFADVGVACAAVAPAQS